MEKDATPMESNRRNATEVNAVEKVRSSGIYAPKSESFCCQFARAAQLTSELLHFASLLS